MRIAVVGAGRMGSGVGLRLARAGHRVAYTFSRDAAKLEELARRSGHGASATDPADAVAHADAVVLAVHWAQVDEALASIGGAAGHVLIDVTNPMNEADDELALGLSTSGGEEVARRAPDARVVKAFNTIPSELLHADLDLLADRPAVCLCGDDAEARTLVAGLIADVGFEPVDVGPLRSARYLEPMAMVVAQLAYDDAHRPEVGYRFLFPAH